jgi:hypothetical protein
MMRACGTLVVLAGGHGASARQRHPKSARRPLTASWAVPEQDGLPGRAAASGPPRSADGILPSLTAAAASSAGPSAGIVARFADLRRHAHSGSDWLRRTAYSMMNLAPSSRAIRRSMVTSSGSGAPDSQRSTRCDGSPRARAKSSGVIPLASQAARICWPMVDDDFEMATRIVGQAAEGKK